MRVLLIGADTSIGMALQSHLLRWGRHEVETLNLSACRWKSERQAKKAARRGGCDAIIDARILACSDSGEILHDIDIKRCHWLAKACQRSGIHYVYLSSSRVFSGRRARPYTELDEADNSETIGELLVQAESSVRDTCEAHLILRFGPIFSSRGINVLTHMLAQLIDGGTLELGNNLHGCPVESMDAARVVAAVVDQVSTGADSWGTYNYCSSDPTHCYEFAEVLLASASQFSEFGANSVQLQLASEQEQLNRQLDCGLILNTFAIKQVAWRGAVADTVKQYFELKLQQELSS